MANVDAPFGLCPITNPYGTTPRLNEYTVTDSIAVYPNQLVCMTAGKLVSFTTTLALAGEVVGVCAGHVSTTDTDRKTQVYDDPDQLFAIQSDDASLTALADYQHLLFSIVNAKSANTTLLHSTSELVGASGTSIPGAFDATGVMPLLCVGKVEATENEIGSGISWTQFKVKITPTYHLNGMGGVGAIAGVTFTGEGT